MQRYIDRAKLELFMEQALAKIERGYTTDIGDARALLDLELIDVAELARLAAAIRTELVRYPAIDPAEFERKVQEFIDNARRDDHP